MSSVVETSLRLAAAPKRRIHEISPRASLGRDDKKEVVAALGMTSGGGGAPLLATLQPGCRGMFVPLQPERNYYLMELWEK